MADYWVSQEKKYCDFCNCWIANNKPSVEFHEKGRRHQQNVKKKLNKITKNSARTQKETERVDVALKQMEKAALEAYKNDIERNGDLTSKTINEKIKNENLVLKSHHKVWHQLKSKEGHLYYWNTLTNETAWEPPKEGYLSLEEQRNQSLQKTKEEMDAVEKSRKKEALVRMHEQQQQDMEEKARQAREKMKERRVQEEPILSAFTGPILEPGNPSPYGKWETVKEIDYQDLQLPEPEYYELPIIPEPEVQQPVREFKEKIVESLEGNYGETSFKKRKLNFFNKKNARQRLDE